MKKKEHKHHYTNYGVQRKTTYYQSGQIGGYQNAEEIFNFCFARNATT